ncbi:MAG: hypothetical protein ACKO9Q_27260, partial [Pirellula sp.]
IHRHARLIVPVFLDSVGKSMALKVSKYKPPGLRPPTADAGFLSAMKELTADGPIVILLRMLRLIRC